MNAQIVTPNAHKLNEISEKIIGCAFTVANKLGNGFLEKVYENALTHELRKAGLDAQQQCPVKVHYDNTVVGEYIADIMVENCVIIELKTVKALDDSHLAQGLNYLRATRLNLCILINFYRPKIEIRRCVHNFPE